MSSQHDDYVAYHNTVNAQNRSNYQTKYRLIGQIPTVIIAISTLCNVFLKDNWHWSVGILSLSAIFCSLITYILLYCLLESSNILNEELLDISAENQNLHPDEQLSEDPNEQKKYDRLNTWTRYVCITSIILCISLTLTTGAIFMSENDTKSKPETITPPQDDNNKGIVSRPIVPESDSIDEGVVTGPIIPEVSPTPPPEQPTVEQPPSSEPQPETPKPEPPPSDKSTE